MQRLSLGVVLLALGLFGTRVGWGWLVERPVLDDDELRAAEAAVDEALADARGGVCERPVLRGVPIPDDATSDFAAMLDPHGRFASCWSLLADRHDEVIAALTVDAAGEEGRAELPIDEQPRGVDSGPEVDPDWTYPAFGRSLRRTPLPVERDVLARCAGLDAEVEQIVRHASVCTPAPIGSALGMEPLLHLGNALAIFVRDRLRNGAIREGFELALDDVRLAQDAMRGRPDLLVALSAALSIRGAVGQLQILLPSELPVDDEALRALEVEARILATTTPSPDRIVRDELIVETLDDLTALGWTPPAGVVLRDDADAAHADPSLVRGILGVTLAHAGFSEGLACAPDTTREECHRRWTSEHTHVEAEAETGALVTLFGPRAARDTIAREAWPERLASLIRQMDRLVQAEAFVRALPAFVAHRRLRGVDACPDLGAIRAMLEHDEEVAWAMQDFGGRLSAHATSLEYGAIDLAAPTWLSDRGPDVRLPLLELYCVRFPLVP